MRLRNALRASALLPLLAGCGSRDGEVVLVHATDPHLFDARRPLQEPLNVQAFQAMMDAVESSGIAGSSPRYLVLTGDLGIESSSPHYPAARTGSAPTARDTGDGTAAAPTPARPGTEQPETPSEPAPDSLAQTVETTEADAGPVTDPATGAAVDASPAAEAEAGTQPQPENPAPAVGDWPKPTAAASASAARLRATQAAQVAAMIDAGPFDRVFFVPGNSDVVLEDARAEALAEVAGFIDAVNARLRVAGEKEVVDLTACYRPGAGDSGCIAQLDSPFALVGFPTVSFANAAPDSAEYRAFLGGRALTDADRRALAGRTARQDSLHQAHLARLQKLVTAASAGSRRAVILTHVADLDDPHAAALVRRGEAAPAGISNARGANAWNVSDAAMVTWRQIVGSAGVAGVLAGHFHDWRRETYRRPYRWSASEGRADRGKIFVAPPLAVNGQGEMPAQARGFALVTLARGAAPRHRLYWYDAAARGFRAERSGRALGSTRMGGNVLGILGDPARLALFSLALLAAFFARGLWRAFDRRRAPKGQTRESVFGGNVLRTLLVGAGGLAAAALLARSWRDPGLDAPTFYVLWFIALFLVGHAFRALRDWWTGGAAAEEPEIPRDTAAERDAARPRIAEQVRVHVERALADVTGGGGGDVAAVTRVEVVQLSRNGRSVVPLTRGDELPTDSLAWGALVLGEPRWWLRAYDDARVDIHPFGSLAPAPVQPPAPQPAGGAQPAAGAQPPAAGAQDPAGARPADGAQRPAAGAQPPAAGAQPAAGAVRKPTRADCLRGKTLAQMADVDEARKTGWDALLVIPSVWRKSGGGAIAIRFVGQNELKRLFGLPDAPGDAAAADALYEVHGDLLHRVPSPELQAVFQLARDVLAELP